LLHTS